MDKFFGVLILCLGIAGVILLSAIWEGYALAVLWGWFIVPVFKLPELRVPVAMGLVLIISFLSHGSSPQKNEDLEWWVPLLTLAIKPLLVLGFGWLIKLFFL
jgi:hypothetical protein